MLEMIIKAARPNISDNSIKQYMSSLRTLNGGSAVPINNVDFLKDFDVVMEKLKEKKPTTIKNYMNAIIVVLGALKMDDVLIKQYEAVRDKLNGQYSEEQATHQKSEAQEKNWVDYDDYVKKVDELGERLDDVKKKAEWSNDDVRRFQEYLIAKLYTVYPLRNDYVMKVVSKAEFNKLSEKDKEQMNYLVVPSNGHTMFFVLNEYKTRRKYGEKRVLIMDAEVQKVLRLWLKRTSHSSLFVDPIKGFDKPADSSTITKILTTMSKREFGGKSVGSSLLRHMYLSSKYADTVKEMEKDADMMGHSGGVQQTIYVKDD
jgi:hypothetical protein